MDSKSKLKQMARIYDPRFWICLFGLLIVAMPQALSADIVGTVTNENGQPLAGVRVDVSTAGPKHGQGVFCPSCYLDCRKSAKTNAEGAFVIRDVDPTLRFHLVATATGKQTALTDWNDPAAAPAEIALKEFPDVAPERILRGHVVNVYGIDVPGAIVSPIGAAIPARRWMGRVTGATSTVTDDHGNFQMLLTEDYLSLDIEILADGSSGLTTEKLAPGNDVHELQVPTGASVKGRVVPEGRPAANQPVAVVQMYRTSGTHFIQSVLCTSDSHGVFEFHNLPVDEPYVVFTPRGVPATGLTLRTSRFQAGADDGMIDLGDIALEPGLRLAGRLITPAGSPPLAGIEIVFGRRPAWDLLSVKTDNEGRLELDGLPSETYDIHFRNDDWIIDELKANYHLTNERGLAWGLRSNKLDLDIPVRRLSKDEPRFGSPNETARDRNLPRSGKQSLAGLVVDRQGNPVANVKVSAQRHAFDYSGNSFVSTKADGTFSLNELPDQPLLLGFRHRNAAVLTSGPTSDSILYMGLRRTEIGQQDIRLAYERHHRSAAFPPPELLGFDDTMQPSDFPYSFPSLSSSDW